MITIKTPDDIAKLKEGGRRLARILVAVAQEAKVGVSTADLDSFAAKLIKEGGDTSAFLNYQPKGAARPYPASLCVSLNDEVVHGIPNEQPRILKEGDLVKLDLGLIHKGMFTDHATTLVIGDPDANIKEFMDVTEKALYIGIKAARAGKKTGDIGFAIQSYVEKYKYGIIEDLAGHGVGYSVHEDPFVPNYGVEGQGALLKPGMVIALEPMLTMGEPDIIVDEDGYTIRTEDGSFATHFEHTILITEGEPEILTKE